MVVAALPAAPDHLAHPRRLVVPARRHRARRGRHQHRQQSPLSPRLAPPEPDRRVRRALGAVHARRAPGGRDSRGDLCGRARPLRRARPERQALAHLVLRHPRAPRARRPRPFHLCAEARGGRRALRDLGGHPARARPPPAGRPPADHALSLRPLRQGEPGHARGRRARVPRRPAHLGRSASAARGLGHGLGAPARARPRSLQSPRLPAGRRSAPHSLALEREDGAARRARDGGRDHRGHAHRPPGHGRAGSGPARSRAVRGRLRHRASDPRRLGRGAGRARDRGASRPRTGAVTAHPDRPRPLPPGGAAPDTHTRGWRSLRELHIELG